jgi:hypothetical protein
MKCTAKSCCGPKAKPEECSEFPEPTINGSVLDDVASANEEMNSWDEAKKFMLHRLHKEYPDIIKKSDLERWCSCHTEIWLSELHCPRYKSIFATKNAKK